MMKNIYLLYFLLLTFSSPLFSQGFPEYAPALEYRIGAYKMLDMVIHDDGSMAFLTEKDFTRGNLILRDADGTITWTQLYTCGQDFPELQHLIAHPDGGYYILGSMRSPYGDSLCADFHFNGFSAYSDVWVLRVDASGDVIWSKNIGGTQTETLNGAKLTKDGGLILFCHSASDDGDNPDSGDPFGTSHMPWVVRIDEDANLLWTHHPLWTQTSSNYYLNGIELENGDFLIFNMEQTDVVQVYRINSNGEQLWKRPIALLEQMQGFYEVQPYGDDKVVLGAIAGLVNGSVFSSTAIIVVDTAGVSLSQRYLYDATKDTYFESMFIKGDELVVAGSIYDRNTLIITTLSLPDLGINNTYSYLSSNIPYVSNMLPIDEDHFAVATDVEPNFDFSHMQGDGFGGGLLIFEKCNLTSDFTWSNTGNNTVQFTNTSSSNAIDYTWDFNNQGSSHSQNPVFTFPSSGNFTVCLEVVNQLLCANRICQLIQVGTTAVEEGFSENVTANVNGDQLNIYNLDQSTAFEIYNTCGSLIQKGTTGLYENNIAISNYPGGIYLLVLKNDGAVRTFPFVKM